LIGQLAALFAFTIKAFAKVCYSFSHVFRQGICCFKFGA